MARIWHITVQLTRVLIKKSNYGFIFIRFSDLYPERCSLLLVIF